MNFNDKEKNRDIGFIMVNPINMIEQPVRQKNQNVINHYDEIQIQKQEKKDAITQQDIKQKNLIEIKQNYTKDIPQVLEKQHLKIEEKHHAEKIKQQKKEQKNNIKQEKMVQKEKNIAFANKQINRKSKTFSEEEKIKQIAKEKPIQQVATKISSSNKMDKVDIKKKSETEKIVNNNPVKINNLLNELLLEKNISTKINQLENDKSISKMKKSNVSDIDINNYLNQIQRAIKNKFYDPDMFKGSHCMVRIKLAPDGLLISATAVNGDKILCQTAINAARIANIPNPPNQDVWKEVKDILLEFRP